MIFEELIIDIQVNERHGVHLSYDTLQLSELVDTELVLKLFHDLLTHLKVHGVIKEFNIFIARR